MVLKKGNNLITGWTDLIGDMLLEGQSIAIGIFSIDGRLLDANAAMCYFLDTDLLNLCPKNEFVNPAFTTFVASQAETVFEGLLTIGNRRNTSFVLNAKVFRRADKIIVFGEADIRQLFEENDKMSSLNQQVNNLQRQLIKEKKNVENTLADLKDTQQMLIHSEKMNAMGKLVAGVAHELNNPIAFVYSNMFTLEEYISQIFQAYSEIEKLISNEANPQLKEAVAEIRKKNDLDFLTADIEDMTKESKNGIERVKAIVEDLRRFSRLDESDIKQVDLVENIRSTVSVARSEISRKNITFNMKGPANLQVECYPGQLNQAILNVLFNAIDAVAMGGNISMALTDEENNVNIIVSDNGCGINEEIKDKVFDPFFTTKPVGSGTGLGLSITYKIIHDMHHGTISIESEPGKGTQVIITIPKLIL